MTTTKMKTIIEAGARRNASATLSQIKQAAATWKPGVQHDARIARMRDHYTGNGGVHIRSMLRRLFPASADQIPVMAYRWAELIAASSAVAYDRPPTRAALTADGVDLGATDLLLSVLSSARAGSILADAERRMQWCGGAIVAVRWRDRYDATAATMMQGVGLDLYWPDEIGLIPHPSSPTDPSMLVGAVVPVATDRGHGTTAVEVWRRETREEGGRVFSFSPWMVGRYDDDGALVSPEVEYPGRRLPLCLMQAGNPSGCPWVSAGDDEAGIIEALGVDVSDGLYLGLMQAHTDRVYQGTRKAASDFEGGPDRVHKIDTGESMTTLDLNPKLQERADGALLRMKMWAMSRRISQDAVSVDAGPPLSGVSRQIANESQTKMRQEQQAAIKEFEEHVFLPTVADVYSAFAVGRGGADIRSFSFSFSPAAQPTYVDEVDAQRMLQADLDLGVISPARYAVERKLYPTIEAAVEAGVSASIATTLTSPYPLSSDVAAPHMTDPAVGGG